MENKSITVQGVKTGLLAAAVSIVIMLLAYVLGISVVGWTFQGISTLFIIGVMIYGLVSFRKAQGYLDFAQGLGIVIIAGVISSLIGYFFTLLYYNVINPGIIDEIMTQSTAMMQKMGMVVNEEMEAQIRQNAEANMHFSFKNMAFGVVGSLFLWTILSLILSAIFKKKNPDDII